MSRKHFYKKNILNNILNKDSKILVLRADKLDENLFNEMGFKNVSHIDGGFNSMKNSGFKIG